MQGNKEKYLIFDICGEEYAVCVFSVREIIRMTGITRLPKAPEFIKGVINLRGNIIPVIDLRAKFGIDERPYDEQTCIIIMELAAAEKSKLMGVIVDRVIEVSSFPEGAVLPPPELNNSEQMAFLKGVARMDDRVVWMLDLDKILSTDELVLIKNIKKGE